LKFKVGDKIRHKKHTNAILQICSIDFVLKTYIIGFSYSVIAVKQDTLEEWYEELLPVEQELW
jgi:hypothetical protein